MKNVDFMTAISVSGLLMCVICCCCDKNILPETQVVSKLHRECIFECFSDKDMQKMFSDKNIDLQKLRIFNKNDIVNAFKDVASFKVSENNSDRRSASKQTKVWIAHQYVSDIPVFAASMVLHCSSDGRITYFDCNFSAAATELKIAAREFPRTIKEKLFGKNDVLNLQTVVFVPELFKMKGDVIVAWKLYCNGQCFIIDQKNGKIVFSYPLHVKHSSM